MPANDKLITREQAAKILSISVSTLRRREGKMLFPVVSPLGQHWFREAEVLALAESGKAAARSCDPTKPPKYISAPRKAFLGRLEKMRETGRSSSSPAYRGRLGPAEWNRFLEAVDNGSTVTELASLLNITETSVYTLLRQT